MEHGHGTRTWNTDVEHGHGTWIGTQTWPRACDLVGSIHEKIRGQKCCDTVPLIAEDIRLVRYLRIIRLSETWFCLVFFISFVNCTISNISFRFVPRFAKWLFHETRNFAKWPIISRNNEIPFASISRNFAKRNFDNKNPNYYAYLRRRIDPVSVAGKSRKVSMKSVHSTWKLILPMESIWVPDQHLKCFQF